MGAPFVPYVWIDALPVPMPPPSTICPPSVVVPPPRSDVVTNAPFFPSESKTTKPEPSTASAARRSPICFSDRKDGRPDASLPGSTTASEPPRGMHGVSATSARPSPTPPS